MICKTLTRSARVMSQHNIQQRERLRQDLYTINDDRTNLASQRLTLKLSRFLRRSTIVEKYEKIEGCGQPAIILRSQIP